MPEQAKWLEIAAVTAMQLLLRLFSPRPSGDHAWAQQARTTSGLHVRLLAVARCPTVHKLTSILHEG